MKHIREIEGEYAYTHRKNGDRSVLVTLEDCHIEGLSLIIDIFQGPNSDKAIKTVEINLDDCSVKEIVEAMS